MSVELRVIDVEYSLSCGSMGAQSTELCDNLKFSVSCSVPHDVPAYGRGLELDDL